MVVLRGIRLRCSWAFLPNVSLVPAVVSRLSSEVYTLRGLEHITGSFCFNARRQWGGGRVGVGVCMRAGTGAAGVWCRHRRRRRCRWIALLLVLLPQPLLLPCSCCCWGFKVQGVSARVAQVAVLATYHLAAPHVPAEILETRIFRQPQDYEQVYQKLRKVRKLKKTSLTCSLESTARHRQKLSRFQNPLTQSTAKTLHRPEPHESPAS